MNSRHLLIVIDVIKDALLKSIKIIIHSLLNGAIREDMTINQLF